MVLLQNISPAKMKDTLSDQGINPDSKPDVTMVTGELDADCPKSPARSSLTSDTCSDSSTARSSVISEKSDSSDQSKENSSPAKSLTSLTSDGSGSCKPGYTIVNGISIPIKPSKTLIPLTECAKHGTGEDCRCKVVFRVTKGK